MNELCITIHNVTDTDHEALIRHIKRTLYDYDPELQVTIPESSFWLSSRKGHSRLYYSECYFIETESRHLLFHCTDKVIRKKGRICELLKRLPEDTFFRCNNSYIVNLHHVREVLPEGDRYSLRLYSGAVVPLSRSHYHECRIKLGILNVSDS